MRGRGRGRAGGVRPREDANKGRSGGGFGRGRNRGEEVPREDNTPKPLSSGPAPDYHFDVRRAVAAAVASDAFVAAQKEIVGDDPANLMGVNSILEEVCNVCDSHVQALPTEAPIDFSKVRRDIEDVVGGFPSCFNSSAATAAFADVFVGRVENRLEKRAPPPKPVDAAPDRKQRRTDQPLPMATSSNGAVLGDQPPQQHIPLPRSHQMHHQPPPFHTGGGGLLGNAPPMPQMMHPPQMVNVFVAPPMQESVPDLGTRYMTLRPLPPNIQNVHTLRNALSELTKSCRTQRITYLNVEVFDENQLLGAEFTAATENGAGPPAAGHFAVVSFTTVSGASEVAFRINTMADRDGTPVRGAGATADEVMLMWGARREELENLEVELGEELDAYPTTRPAALYEQLDALKSSKTAAMEKVAELKAAATPDKEALKEVYMGIIDITKKIEEVSQRLGSGFRLNPNAAQEERAVPAERFSSSNAEPGSMAQLLFISGAAAPMPDDMLLLLLRKLQIVPVHIWRDPSSTTISVEVESPGAAFGVLRRLDFIDNCICGLTISKERPRDGAQQ